MPTGDSRELEVVGLVGQWIGAVLETAGLYALSDILTTFAAYFFAIAIFAYVVSVLASFFSGAVYGQFSNAVYLLIGPALFYFLLMYRVDTVGAKYQFGVREMEKDHEKQMAVLNKDEDPIYQNPAKVPFFLARFDMFVSKIAKGLEAYFVDTANRSDLISAGRERMLSRLWSAKGRNPQFYELLHLSLMGECGDYVNASLTLASVDSRREPSGSYVGMVNGGRDALQDERLARLTAQKAELSKKRVIIRPSLREYLSGIGEKLPASLKSKFDAVDTSKSVTCEQVWQLNLAAAAVGVDNELNPTDKELASFDLDKRQWACVAAHVKSKYGLSPDSVQQQCLAKGESSDGIADDAEPLLLMASYYLRNTMRESSVDVAVSRVYGRAQWNEGVFTTIFGEKAGLFITNLKVQVTQFASYIPYVQGVIYYLIVIMYPIFAILVLSPWHKGSIIVWMSCFCWVKSWEPAFACVYFFRNAYWNMIPNAGGRRAGDNFTNTILSDPGALLSHTWKEDPLSGTIMADIMVLMVPYIMAQVFSHARQLFNSLKTLITGPVESFGKRHLYGMDRNPFSGTVGQKDALKWMIPAGLSVAATRLSGEGIRRAPSGMLYNKYSNMKPQYQMLIDSQLASVTAQLSRPFDTNEMNRSELWKTYTNLNAIKLAISNGVMTEQLASWIANPWFYGSGAIPGAPTDSNSGQGSPASATPTSWPDTGNRRRIGPDSNGSVEVPKG